MEERYQAELSRSTSVLDDVDRALQRLSDGTYGDCETCGSPILPVDLERDPTRRYCEQHLFSGDSGDSGDSDHLADPDDVANSDD